MRTLWSRVSCIDGCLRYTARQSRAYGDHRSGHGVSLGRGAALDGPANFKRKAIDAGKWRVIANMQQDPAFKYIA